MPSCEINRFMNKVYYTPIELPNLEPDNWDLFWKIWKEKAENVSKLFKHKSPYTRLPVGDSTRWRGIEIFNPKNVNHALVMPKLDVSSLFPKMHETMVQLQEHFEGYLKITLIESLRHIHSHTDTARDTWQLRQYFHYPAPNQQWFFTKPLDIEGPKTFIKMPEDTKWFGFNDGLAWHGTIYDSKYPKVIVKLYGTPKMSLIEKSIETYENYTLRFD